MSEYQQKHKGRRKLFEELSYEELLEMFTSTGRKTATVYVPLLCKALKKEHPEYTNAQIKDKVIEDCVNAGWSRSQITEVLSTATDIMDDDPNHLNAVKAWKSRNANKIKRLRETASLLNEVDLPPAPSPTNREPEQEEDLEFEDTHFTEYGSKGKTTSQLFGDITSSAQKLFQALTDKEFMPHDDEDVLVDYIKPTEDFRRSIALELNSMQKKIIWNDLLSVQAAITSLLDIFEKNKK